MSYRDIRNCIEMLRTVGYPNMVSLESFRKPNFPLVASLLVWLAKRFEPDADIDDKIDTEDDRVNLIRQVAQFMALKANIKLNTKRLYQADGHAVKEILKITSLLYEAMQNNNNEELQSNEREYSAGLREFDIADKLHDLKQSRQLASEITSTGATLFELLGKEVDLRVLRNTSAARQYEVSDIENGLKIATETIKQEINETKDMIDNVSATEANLDAKIERRKIEIDRYEKRLQTLKKVRPAFLEEFNSLELELNSLFEQYSLRSRCLAQLEKLAAEAERQQLERHIQIASLQKSISDVIPLEVEDHDEEKDDEKDSAFLIKEMASETPEIRKLPSRQERPRARTGGRQEPRKTSVSSLSSDSESDELFLDKDLEPELVHSDEDSLGFELSGMELTSTNKRAPSGRVTKLQDNSDDDF